MTTTAQIVEFLDLQQFTPALINGSPECRRRTQFARMCIQRLPPTSAIRYCINAADESIPNRELSNDLLHGEGFLTFSELLPQLRERFSDVWPSDGPA